MDHPTLPDTTIQALAKELANLSLTEAFVYKLMDIAGGKHPELLDSENDMSRLIASVCDNIKAEWVS